ncbi:MAG: amidohydrolase family protein [Ruminococcus sp.]
MIIDFHTHVFPDAIAEKTIGLLAARSGYTPYGNGTREQLLSLMKKGGVDHSVILPVVTKPSQFQSINQFAAALNETDGLYSFGGIHPDDETPEEHLEQIQAMGLYGIKIHPDYQNVPIYDPRYIRIIRYALSLGLAVVTHAGVDDGCIGETKCTPDGILRMLDAVCKGNPSAQLKMVLAHAGSYKMYDQVLEKLCGLPVFFDLACVLEFADPSVLLSIIRTHGADKILFATDSPWSDPARSLARLKEMPLTEQERNQILFQNALSILRK